MKAGIKQLGGNIICIPNKMLYLRKPIKRRCIIITLEIRIVLMTQIDYYAEGEGHSKFCMSSSSLRSQYNDNISLLYPIIFLFANMPQCFDICCFLWDMGCPVIKERRPVIGMCPAGVFKQFGKTADPDFQNRAAWCSEGFHSHNKAWYKLGMI